MRQEGAAIMAKQRKGSDKATEQAQQTPVAEQGERPALQDQAALGNAVLQARMETGEATVEGAAPGLEVVAAVAEPLVRRAIAALQLDATDAERLARRVEILERSHLPEKQALIDQLHSDETTRTTVEGLLTRHFGGAGPDTRDRVDAVLDSVRSALEQGQATAEGWRDPTGVVAVGDSEGSLDTRAASLVASLAEARAPEAARTLADQGVGVATSSLVRSLALMVLLDEEEEEEGFVEDGWEVEGA